MSAYLKPVLVLLISILLFAGIFFLADKELIDFVQTRFYNPSVLNSFIRENSRDAEIAQGYIFELQNKFAAALNEPAVQSSFLYNQSQEDIYERSRIFGILLETTAGLQSVQFVDSNGIRLHYSTYVRDIIGQSAGSTAYRNYSDNPLALPYDRVSVAANNSAKFSMDEQSDRIIFSFPFNDSMDVYRGTALYTVSVRALAEKLVAEGRLKVNENVSVTGIPPGILLGSPDTSKAGILGRVSQIWNAGIQDRVTFDSGDSGMKFSLISLRTDRGIFFGRLVNDELFYISDSMKNILLLSMFLTFYLTLLFIVNFRPIPATLVRNRIKRLRESLFEQLYVNKSEQERAKWILELEQRREEIRSELKRDLKPGQSAEDNINGIIDKSWDELLAVMKAGGETRVIAASSESSIAQAEAKEAGIEELEEIEEAGEVEILEEIEEVEALEEIADLEELEEIEEAEAFDEVAYIEKIEEVEEAEALDEAAPAHASGLLTLASEIAAEEKTDETKAPPPKRGLLSLAASKESSDEKEPDDTASQRRGLLALASDIEFNREFPAGDVEEAEENEADLDTNLDIVSPFSSMFESLDGDEKN
jgi:hypothetical protein